MIDMRASEFSLTIITVCRNALPLLRATLENVLEYKRGHSLDIEHLIVDGASTDGTPASLVTWQQEGVIEAYISEPDAGIYDAMNKGIRLARGKVLYFLNAGDLLTGASLADCIAPLLEDRGATAAAPVLMKSAGGEKIDAPSYAHVYLGTPVCHQGFFATAALYRELGGYDTAHFRCLADADFMNRAHAASGAPYISPAPVAVYADGGFSENCGYRFLPEYLYMRDRHWEKIMERSSAEPMYAELISYAMLDHAVSMMRWVQEFGLEDSHAEILLRHVQTQRRATRSARQRFMLGWVEKYCLKPLLAGAVPAPKVSKVLKWFCIAGSLSAGNPYIHPDFYPSRSLIKAIFALLRARLFR